MKNKTKITIALILALAVVLSFAGCGKEKQSEKEEEAPSVTIEELVAANNQEAVFSRHKNVLVTFYGGFDATDKQQYRSEDLAWILFEDGSVLVDHEHSWLMTNDIFAMDVYAMSEEEAAKRQVRVENYLPPVIADETIQEEITEVRKEKDGTLLIRTYLDLEKSIRKHITLDYSYEYIDLEEEAYYTVDAKTLEIREAEYYFLKGEEEILIRGEIYDYDADMPNDMKEMTQRADEYRESLRNTPANPKVVTVIYDAGTDKEEKYSVTVDQDQMIRYFLKNGYVEDTDKAESTTKDGTLYLTKYAVPYQ